MTTDIASESQTDRIVRLALTAGRLRQELADARAACAGCQHCDPTAVAEARRAGADAWRR